MRTDPARPRPHGPSARSNPREARRFAAARLAAALALAAAGPLGAQDRPAYHASTAELIGRGQEALAVCNGVFVSGRTLDQLAAAELAPMERPLSEIRIDREREVVAVGTDGAGGVPVMRAAHRPGVGCVVMAPDQTLDDVAKLPALALPPLPGDAAAIPWPDGDRVEAKPLPAGVNAAALAAASDWAFDRAAHGAPSQVTISLLVVHRGDIVHERYAPGFDASTRTRTWSAAKSIASTLVGIAVGRGLLRLDEPLPIAWPPDELNELDRRVAARFPMIPVDAWPPPGYSPAPDPRRRITLRHVLNMSSGLYPVDNERAGSIGSFLSYFAGWSSARGASDRGLVREPGTVWDYENYDTILALLALREAIGDRQTYLEFPRRALFDRIGMRSTVAGVDRFGDFVMSSQVYTNARDLARLGLLYLNRGTWNGERVLPEAWVDFVRTPAPSTRRFGNFYGGQWWLVPDARTDLPQDAYTAAGAGGQYVVVVPSHELVIVRRALDRGGPAFPVWDLLAEVLEAFPERPGGAKPVAAEAEAAR